jgi:hypothetical protein
MAELQAPHEPKDSPDPRDADDSQPEDAPKVLRLRIAPWDVGCTVALLIALIVLATATTWPAKLFSFLPQVCQGDTCGPVPFGVDYYIFPLVWGGIGAAITAAVLGPIVSLLKGWYMSFWPVLSLALLVLASVVGSLLTAFSQSYWG